MTIRPPEIGSDQVLALGDGPDDLSHRRPEVVAFEGELVGADATADHLRTAAELVARARHCAAERARLEVDLAGLAEAVETWREGESALFAELQGWWARCAPGDPDGDLASVCD